MTGVVVVLTALNVEHLAVRAHLTGVRERVHPAGTIFEVGRLPGVPGQVVLAVTGEGTMGAAVLSERAIVMFAPRALLFVGVAGALKDSLALGDVVVAKKVYAYQGGKERQDGFGGRPRSWDAPHELLQRALSIQRDGGWTRRLPGPAPAVHVEAIAVGDVVLDARGGPLARHLRDRFEDAGAIEMEGAGAALAGHFNRDLPVMVVRGISDRADGTKATADGAGWQPLAACNAAAFAIELAAQILASPRPPGTTQHRGPAGMAGDADVSGAGAAWTVDLPGAGVVWRADLMPVAGPAVLEVHVVPGCPVAAGIGDLIARGRIEGLFGPDEPVVTHTGTAVTWAVAEGGGAAHDSGQRSAWQALPHDPLGSVLDPDDLTARIARLVAAAAAGLPPDLEVVLAAGIDPVRAVTEGWMALMPRSGAPLATPRERTRVVAPEPVAVRALAERRPEVATRLAELLLARFRAGR